MEIKILNVYGSHPTRATGTVGDHPWLYQSRFGRWTLTVCAVPGPSFSGDPDDDWCFAGEDVYMGEVPPDVVERLVLGLLSRPQRAWPRRVDYGEVSLSAPLHSRSDP